ncbi:MAG: uroporphyrinogen decarboxylase family protein [Chloroflexota bacterium]
MPQLLPTTVVGSYPQPDWLVDRENLGSRLPPRVRAREVWRVAEAYLEQAQDDATILAIRAMERAGIDIVSDGEIRRESYSNRLANAFSGLDPENPGTAIDRTGHPNPVPRVVGPIRRTRQIEVRDLEFLRANTDRQVKITLPGPFTVTQQAQNDYYADVEAWAMDVAAAINEEIKDLFVAGADVVQLDEPYLQARPEQARNYALKAINRALDGVQGTTALHSCFGYAHIVHNRLQAYPFLAELNDSAVDQLSIEAAQPQLDLSILRSVPDKIIILGVLDLGNPEVETPEIVADRIRAALQFISPERLVLAPDCGMKYLPRDIADGKLRAMVVAANIVRNELGA